MAIVSSIAVGRARNSAGNVTFTTVKGRVIMKQKAEIVANPRSEGQVEQRSKLSKAVLAWQKVGNLAGDGLTRRGKYLSAYNRSIQLNIEDIDAVVPNAPLEDSLGFEGLIIADGSLNGAPFSLAKDAVGVNIDLNLDPDTIGDLKIGDIVSCVSYAQSSGQKNKIDYVLTSADFTAGSVFIDCPLSSALASTIVTAGVYFKTADGKESSSGVMQSV